MMRKREYVFTVLLFAVMAMGWFASCAQAEQESIPFLSETYGFAAQYPKGWHLSRGDGVLDIENFPASKAVIGMHIPTGGAEIDLFPLTAARRNAEVTTIDEWIQVDLNGNIPKSRQTFNLAIAHGKLSIIAIRDICCADAQPKQEWVTWYFIFGGARSRLPWDIRTEI